MTPNYCFFFVLFFIGHRRRKNKWARNYAMHNYVPTLCLIHYWFVFKFLANFTSVGEKRVFLQLICCKNLYHQSRRENRKITVNIKVIKWHNENLLVLTHLASLVKLHYFQFAFLENCGYKKQKKSIKDQRNFCLNTFFEVFANFVSAHSKIWCLRFFYKQNDINFFIPPVGDLPEIEECLIWQLQRSAIHSPNINFVCFLNHQSVNL